MRSRLLICFCASIFVGGLGLSLSVRAGEDVLETYNVRRGDTLFGLAKRFYNDVSCWPLIASIPGNHAYYPGPLWIGKIAVPPKEQCDQLHHPLSPVGLKEVSSTILANVSAKPWRIGTHLASTYVEGHFRSEAERLSTYRVRPYLNRIKDNVSEWTMTWNDGGSPMTAFMDATHLAEGYLYRPYWISINNLPLTSTEQENSAFWQERLKPYVSDTSFRGAWEERHVSEYIRYLDGSHWAMNVPRMFTAENGRTYRGPQSFYVIDGKETETYYHAFGLALLPNGSWAFRYQQPDATIPISNNWKCEPEKNDVCAGPWFIKTNKTEYGPYNHPTPPAATADGSFWYLDITGPGGTFVLYRDGEKKVVVGKKSAKMALIALLICVLVAAPVLVYNYSLYTEKGFWGNLPEGEAFIAPVEGTVNGTMIIDGSIAGVGKVKNAKIVIKGGFAVSVDNKQLNDAIESVNDHNARNIAEFGIGTNEKARVTGIVLEDEKVFGTCHIALGNSIGFGGTIDVPFHVDCVMRSPTILIDNRSIMKDGKLLI